MYRICGENRTIPSAPVSLKANFAATFAGNVVFAASQWAILSLFAKLGDAEMLGQYALALAIASPIAMFSHLNLRAVLATDVGERHPFGDYLAVRLETTALGLAATLAVALAAGYPQPVPAAICLLGLMLGIDHVSDLYYGLWQRRERMDRIARSMISRGLLSAAAVAAALWFTRNLTAAVLALAAARVLVFFFFDRPGAAQAEERPQAPFRTRLAILRTALPLGVVLMLISLTANLPRYAIESRLGTAELGAFAAVASFLTVGSTVANALGQAATPRLARYFSAREIRRFRGLTLRLAGLAVLLGLAGILAAAALGRPLLILLYRPAYAAYDGLLLWTMGAGVCSYLAVILGYVVTSARSFAIQVPLLAAVAASSGVASWALVPRIGLKGAALALAVAWSVQIGGELLILRRECAREALL